MLKNHISIFLGLLSLVILFHITIILKIVPYDMVWGGRLASDIEMYVFETISILYQYISIPYFIDESKSFCKYSEKIINGILWGFYMVFILKALGIYLQKHFSRRVFLY